MQFFGFTIDLWTIYGLVGQGIFFSSFVIQWYKSERKGKSHLPIEFWYLRLLGSVIIFTYVMQRRDIVFLLATIFQVFIYLRNIRLMKKHDKK